MNFGNEFLAIVAVEFHKRFTYEYWITDCEFRIGSADIGNHGTTSRITSNHWCGIYRGPNLERKTTVLCETITNGQYLTVQSLNSHVVLDEIFILTKL